MDFGNVLALIYIQIVLLDLKSSFSRAKHMNRGGFSWKRFLGITRVKSNISRKIGIPLTKSGRNQKIGRTVSRGCLGVIAVLGAPFLAVLLFLLIALT